MDARVKPAHDGFLLLQMPGEEAEAARPGDVRACLVVTRPLIAVEAMLRARIDMDLDFGALGLDSLDVGKRNPRVFFAEMKLGRNGRLVVSEANDGAAVIADRSRQPRQFCRGGIGDAAAQTK